MICFTPSIEDIYVYLPTIALLIWAHVQWPDQSFPQKITAQSYMYMWHTGVQSHHALDFSSAILYPVCVAGSSKSQVFKWPKSDSFHTWNSGKLSRRFKYSAMGIGGKSLYMLTWWLEQQFSGFTFLPCDVGKWLNCVPPSHASYIYFPNSPQAISFIIIM